MISLIITKQSEQHKRRTTQKEKQSNQQTSGHNLDTCIYFKQCCLVCKSRFSVGWLLVKTSYKDFFCRVYGVTIMVRFVGTLMVPHQVNWSSWAWPRSTHWLVCWPLNKTDGCVLLGQSSDRRHVPASQWNHSSSCLYHTSHASRSCALSLCQLQWLLPLGTRLLGSSGLGPSEQNWVIVHPCPGVPAGLRPKTDSAIGQLNCAHRTGRNRAAWVGEWVAQVLFGLPWHLLTQSRRLWSSPQLGLVRARWNSNPALVYRLLISSKPALVYWLLLELTPSWTCMCNFQHSGTCWPLCDMDGSKQGKVVDLSSSLWHSPIW